MKDKSQLSQECIYEKKVAEIKARQQISETNGRYKVEKLQAMKERDEAKAAKKAARDAEIKAAQAKYANKR